MSSGSLAIIIDNTPPESVTLSINGDYQTTAVRLVDFTLLCKDDLGGQFDLREMKVWGDVETDGRSGFAATEGAAQWIPFVRSMKILLSCGSGSKTVNAKVRDSVGNESATTSANVTLNLPSIPEVTILVPPRRKRFSSNTGYDTITFTWIADRAFTEYKVCLMDSTEGTESDGTLLTAGTNISGSGSWSAGQQITTTITADTLLSMSDGSGTKLVKVFVKVGSVWSE